MGRWTAQERWRYDQRMTEHGFREEDIGLGSADAQLWGTLLVPDRRDDRMTVVLIIPGSGPTDRDGNSPLLPGKIDSLKLLAQALGRAGFASLRIDKRAIGKSVWEGLSEETLSFDDYPADVVEWVGMLRADRRFARIVLVGHSEGGLVALAAAQKAGVEGIVLIASPGESYQATIAAQLAGIPEALRAEAGRILSELEKGRRVDTVADELMMLFRPSVQPFLISAFRYDPAQLISRIHTDVLIMQGERDLQVPRRHGERLSDASPGARLVTVPEMNHVLKRVGETRESNIAAYGDPSLPLAPGLVEPVIEFLQAHPA